MRFQRRNPWEDYEVSFGISFTASGKSTPVHVLLAYCGLFQSRDKRDL